jgi:cell shape-determining protein MreD
MGTGQRGADLWIQVLLPTAVGALMVLITGLAVWLGFLQRTWTEAILPVLVGTLSFAIVSALVRFLVFFRKR